MPEDDIAYQLIEDKEDNNPVAHIRIVLNKADWIADSGATS